MKKIYIFLLLILAISCKKQELYDAVEPNRAYVVNGGSKTVSVIDLTSLEVVNTISLTTNDSIFPHHIYLSPDQLQLAIAMPEHDFSKGHNALHNNPRKGGVAVIDLSKANKVRTFDVVNANHNAIFSPDGREVWTAGYSHTGRIYVYDADSGKLKNEITVDADPSEVVFSSDGVYGLVTSGEGAFLQVIDVQTKSLEKKIKIDLAPSNVWTGKDNKVLISNAFKNSINVVDLNLLKVTDFLDFSFTPGFMAYLNEDIWVADPKNHRIVIIEKTTEGLKETATITFEDDTDPHMFQFFDNGQKALVILQNKAQAVVIDTQTLEQMKIINVGQKPNGITISQ